MFRTTRPLSFFIAPVITTIGLVYMDEFSRSTTSLVSPNNAVHIPCGFSANQNSIQVVIPVTQKAPAWAKRYKFVIKPDEENYETI
jgi:hypothetical protein